MLKKFRIPVFIAVLILLTWSCMNIFKPKDYSININDKNPAEINDIDTLMAYGDMALLQTNYPLAVQFFERVIELEKRNSTARLKASQALLASQKDKVLYMLQILLDAEDDQTLTILLDEIPNNTLFDKDGALNKAMLALNDPSQNYSVFEPGETDGVIPTNSFEANVNYLTAGVLLFPVKIFDSDDDFRYNESNLLPENGGDILIYDTSDDTINLNYDFSPFSNSIFGLISAVGTDFANLIATDNTNFDVRDYNTELGIIHSNIIELAIGHTYNMDLFGDLQLMRDCIYRVVSIAPDIQEVSDLTNIFEKYLTNFTEAQFTSNTNFLSAEGLNTTHYELCGDYAYNPVLGVDTYSFSDWPSFPSVTAGTASAQESCKDLYDSYQVLVSYTVPSADYYSFLTTNYIYAFSNFMTNLIDLTNGLDQFFPK